MNSGLDYSACVVTYGCQQNEADSEKIAGMLHASGYSIVKEPALADVIIVNTCAVREHAEERALSITGGYKHLKTARPHLKIGICGCMVSKADMSDKIKKSYPYVDFVFGTEKLSHLPEILYRSYEKKKRIFVPNDGETQIAEGLPVIRESTFRAWVSIMYGCNNFCTYCIVPYVRGRERSRRPEMIIEEVRELAASGCKEITLLGQNVNSYGKEFGGECNFATLLSRLCEIEGDFTLRFMTSHPKDASFELIDIMAKNDKIAKHFHLPVQSGSDRMLREMNRHYNKETYLSLVDYMREKMPDIAISTDIIVGFPGETEEDFEDTLELMKRVKYDMIFSFIYSPRTGTPAAKMEQVPDNIKTERMNRLLALQNELLAEKNEAYVGKTMRVLVEGKSKTNEAKMSARTEGNRIVLFDGDESLTGKFINLKITKSAPFALIGETEA
ncbi:MAG: tRNA (N6-isopentenyl adenosine(37)-C2)-methylthiotransferase MiaB [Ruminococcaceae bacterium]|nr:tRNA (N6-isopentenyl adenosine(37)-C2)-methylthiotransferase MiaB [Oscillospiraceae bacterium]MBO5022910.1 tRNA (N6-isopentenyl adenosine(37)-C2)-methylthiotransferase MiaB [Clostridia bacterium]